MKQLLIVSNGTLNGGATKPTDLSSMTKGAIGFFQLDKLGAWLDAAPTDNFGIALGGGSDALPFIIPEVDIKSLQVQKSSPAAGAAKVVTFTFPTPVVGKEYTVIIVKKGVVFNERSNWTSNVIASTTTVATEAGKLVKAINANNSIHGVTASISSATVTLTGTKGIDFEVKLVDGLSNITPNISTPFSQSVGQKADIQELALACAAGKGFEYLADEGTEIYPGFPEAVNDAQYYLYTLRFKVGREASKQRDEQVWQTVHIAVPKNTANDTASTGLIAKIDTILALNKE